MRRELTAILLVFLVIVILLSLLSFSPADPSIYNATRGYPVHNLFGVVGAQLAGLLIGLFGLGAFWIPALLALVGIRVVLRGRRLKTEMTFFGGLLLVVSTGALISMAKSHVVMLGSRFSAGGLVGFYFQAFFVHYCNVIGTSLILSVMWISGLVLATGVSLAGTVSGLWHGAQQAVAAGGTWLEKWHQSRKRKPALPVPSTPAGAASKTLEIKPAVASRRVKPTPVPQQEVFDFMKTESLFQLPPVSLLVDATLRPDSIDAAHLRMQSQQLEAKLADFGVQGHVETVSPGPVITTFEYAPAPGVKINKIVNLTDDLALALRAISIRIVAPIPGKAAIGIEIPNPHREMVRFKEVITSPVFSGTGSALTLCLGKDIVGHPVVAELDKMPHLLIAGATGSGKSVALNAMICSFLYKSTPETVRFIMVDPKRIELSTYDGIPHLITPVVTDAKKATNALFWAVREMERRYELLSRMGARNIRQFNQKAVKHGADKPPDEQTAPDLCEPLPFIVIIIDELADLMMVSSRDVEVALTRLAQMARAAGIHLMLATQRPSVDVLTGVIKANFPTRLTFQVSSKTDSRTILDANGAENLLGDGDMLFMPPGTARLQRIHGAYISETEIAAITDFLKTQKKPEYNESVTQALPEASDTEGEKEYDERYDEAVALITQTRQASISMIQRHLRIGYNRAARIIEQMETDGIVGPSDGAKPREVLVAGYDQIR